MLTSFQVMAWPHLINICAMLPMLNYFISLIHLSLSLLYVVMSHLQEPSTRLCILPRILKIQHQLLPFLSPEAVHCILEIF